MITLTEAPLGQQMVLPGCPDISTVTDAERFAAMASEVMAQALRLNALGCRIDCAITGYGRGVELDVWSQLTGPAPSRPLYGNNRGTSCATAGNEIEHDRYIRESYCAHPQWPQYGDPFKALESMLQALNYVEHNIEAFQVALALEA